MFIYTTLRVPLSVSDWKVYGGPERLGGVLLSVRPVDRKHQNSKVCSNKFKGKIGIFEINKKKISHLLNFYVAEGEEFKKIF